MKLEQMVDGFLLFKTSENVSNRTIENYGTCLRHFLYYAGNIDSKELTSDTVIQFLAFMRDEYRMSNGKQLSSQSIRNIWVAMKSFSRWMHDTLKLPNVMSDGKVPVPKATSAPTVPFTKEEVRILIGSIQIVRGARGRGVVYLRRLASKAIILTLLDTGIRNTELCEARIGDWSARTGQLKVHGKGDKYRIVYIGQKTRPILWQYLQERPDGNDPTRPLFAQDDGSPHTMRTMLRKVKHVGDAAGVPHCHPHRFRHTFAIQYLRNGGDIFTLQSLLGHTTMTMVQHYLTLAQTDVETAHRRASPVDNWL